MNYNINSGYGQALLNGIQAQVPALGRIFIVVSTSDAGEERYDRLTEMFRPDPNGQIRLFTSLESAYAAATSNNNDVIVLDGDSTHTIANGIAWSKSRVHLIGFDGGDRLIQQGAKVQSTDAAADAYVIKVTGTRNSFRNVKFIQVDTNAAALHVLEEGGEGNLYKNCSFVFGVADNLDQTNAYEVLSGSDSATYLNCTFGSDTLLTSAARAVFAMDNVTSSQEFKSNIVKDCVWQIMSSSADANFIRVLSTADVKFTNTFINPTFIAAINSSNSAVTLTDAVDSVSGLVEGNMLFVNPSSNCTNFASAITDNIKVCGPGVATQAAFIGVGVVPS